MEMHIKITVLHHYTPTKTSKMKDGRQVSAGEDMEPNPMLLVGV